MAPLISSATSGGVNPSGVTSAGVTSGGVNHGGVTSDSASSVDQSKKDPIEMEIEAVCRKSLINDYKARHDSLVSILMVVFEMLIGKTSDEEFRLLIPHVFETATQLVSHATDAKLRQSVSDWFKRLGQLHGMRSEEEEEEMEDEEREEERDEDRV